MVYRLNFNGHRLENEFIILSQFDYRQTIVLSGHGEIGKGAKDWLYLVFSNMELENTMKFDFGLWNVTE